MPADLLARPPAPRRIRSHHRHQGADHGAARAPPPPGVMLVAGNRQAQVVVRVVAVDDDGQVHFTVLPGSVDKNCHLRAWSSTAISSSPMTWTCRRWNTRSCAASTCSGNAGPKSNTYTSRQSPRPGRPAPHDPASLPPTAGNPVRPHRQGRTPYDLAGRRSQALSSETSIGLVGLKDRVEAVGGRIFVDSRLGARTSLQAEFPLTATHDRVTSRQPGPGTVGNGRDIPGPRCRDGLPVHVEVGEAGGVAAVSGGDRHRVQAGKIQARNTRCVLEYAERLQDGIEGTNAAAYAYRASATDASR